MIFKSLLTPKYKHKDPQVRQIAINSLSAADAEQKSQLHELAFNDANTSVRLAALTKLGQFSLWWKVAQTDNNPQIKKKAYQVVEDSLLDNTSLAISVSERQQFINQCTNNAFLEKLAKHTQDSALVLSILGKLNKPQLNRQLFFSTEDAKLQEALLSEFDDIASLLKVLKKVSSAHIKSLAEEKLQQLQQLQNFTQDLTRKSKLVLAKLASCKDTGDYGSLELQQQHLNAEYSQLQIHFNQLPNIQATEFADKYQQLQQMIATRLQKLLPEWQQQQQQQAQQQAEQQQLQAVEELIKRIQQQLQQQVQTLDSETQVELIQQLQDAEPVLVGISNQQAQQLRKESQQLQSQLKDLPEVQQCHLQAAEVFQQLQQLVLPTDIEQWLAVKADFETIKQQWQSLNGAVKRLQLSELAQQWRQYSQPWNQQIKALEADINETLAQGRQQLKKFDRLIQVGKFHGAMSLHRKLVQQLQSLPVVYQVQLQSGLDKASEEVAKLQDLQAFIAQPRKPELIAEAQKLAEQAQQISLSTTPADSVAKAIADMAAQVKTSRQQWNSLGKFDTDEDKLLNKQFDELSELAFAPCRQFYQQQEQQRQQNLQAKQALITEYKNVFAGDQSELDKVQGFNRLEQAWLKIGHVAQEDYKALQQQYLEAKTPLKALAKGFYQDNETQKRQLIKQAGELLTLEDNQQAVEQSKSLQEKWKKTASAGRKVDNQLWSEFRSINDQVFSQRKEIQQEVQANEKATIEQLQSHFSQWQQVLAEATERSALRAQVEEMTETINGLMQTLLPKASQKMRERLAAMQLSTKNTLQQLSVQAQHQQYSDLYEVLKQWQGDELPELAQKLPNAWLQALKEQATDIDRQQLTVQMEIVADKPSPQQDALVRKQLQLQMMASKLEHGEQLELVELLVKWLRGGPVSKAQLDLIDRIAELF
ncbi:DUF349 domain-containing protein [Alteromonadaceae bacterium BrNp21-10]|nr:DUF349 domain-containing protein [Alteromonadaceae bacterium BrNp21-10]